MGERKQDVLCLFFNKMNKQIIPVSLSLLLCAFPSSNISSIQITLNYGLRLFAAKARLSSFAVS